MTYNIDFQKVDDADIQGLLVHESRTRAIEAKRGWIDFEKLRSAKQLKLGKFYMHGVQFIVVHYKDGMFIRAANSFAPCGYFTYANVE